MKWTFLGMVACFIMALVCFHIGKEWTFLGQLYVVGGIFSGVILALQIFTGREEI